MQIKKFYSEHKKEIKYMLGLLLLFIALTAFFYSLTQLIISNCCSTAYIDNGKAHEKDEPSFSKKDTLTILTLIEEGKKGNLPAIAGLFSYPIERRYPLPPIKDSAAFVRYGEIIFDDSLKQILSETTIDEWENYGWRGTTFRDGHYFWESGFDGGKIVAINYLSEKERTLREQYIEEEIESLHPSLREDVKIPITTFLSENAQWIGRIDLLKSDVHRLALYKKGSDLSSLPYFIAEESCYEIQGSEGNKYFQFKNDSIEIELLICSYSSSSLWIKQNNISQKNDICPDLWRDIIRSINKSEE